MTRSDPAILKYLYEEQGPRAKRITLIATALSALLVIALLVQIILRFYKTGQLDRQYWFFFARGTTWSFLARGILGTIESSVLSGVVAFALGFVFMLGRLSKSRIVRGISVSLIEFTRGVPTLLFIYFFFLGLPALGVKMSALLKIALPVALSASGVVAEVLRGGVNAVPNGQREAALSLGLSDWKTFVKIIFPQGFKYVIPALISEVVIVVKDTTFAYIVSFPDLMQNSKVLISNYDAMLSVYLLVAVIYILINYLLNKLSAFVAQNNGRKIGYGRNGNRTEAR